MSIGTPGSSRIVTGVPFARATVKRPSGPRLVPGRISSKSIRRTKSPYLPSGKAAGAGQGALCSYIASSSPAYFS
jgi:hypothetical protein